LAADAVASRHRRPGDPAHPVDAISMTAEDGRRHLVGAWDSDELPPPDSLFPENYDPCQTVDPPPIGDVTPVVLTDRTFTMSQMPLGAIGTLYNGTKEALGGWTKATLIACAAKSARVITAQGPYKQYQPGGIFVRDTFIDISIAKIRPLYTMLVDYVGLGVLLWHSMADDWESHSLWKPSGIPEADLVYARGVLQAEFPDLPLGIRSLPTQFALGNPGFAGYNAQFKSWGGYTAFNFGATMYALAAAWGAAISMDLNYLAGGDGSSGYPVFDGTMLSGHDAASAAEIIAYFHGMYTGCASVDAGVRKLVGSFGYQFNQAYLNDVPGVVDAQATEHNELAGFPPP
jgi:hypothetical protein